MMTIIIILGLVKPPGEDEFIASMFCQLFTRDISSIDLSSSVLDAFQPLIIEQQSFVYQMESYPSTIQTTLTSPIKNKKTYSHLLRCLQPSELETSLQVDLSTILRVHSPHVLDKDLRRRTNVERRRGSSLWRQRRVIPIGQERLCSAFSRRSRVQQ